MNDPVKIYGDALDGFRKCFHSQIIPDRFADIASDQISLGIYRFGSVSSCRVTGPSFVGCTALPGLASGNESCATFTANHFPGEDMPIGMTGRLIVISVSFQ
jgi:hypothetical protein